VSSSPSHAAVSDAATTYALLADGSTIEISPARPASAGAVRAMHDALSPENLYLRFFSLGRGNAEREACRVCRPAGPDHAALLGWLDGELAGVASYEATSDAGVAEIAFAVPDHLHGRGIATLLLEHLVSVARLRQVRAFTAETLQENYAMLRVFADAGLPVRRRTRDGLAELTFPLPAAGGGEALDAYLTSVAARESRADVASLRHLLAPMSVAVIGAGRRRGTVGREVLHNIVAGGFAGPVYPVNPRARSMEGLPCLPSADDLPAGVDLAVLAVPAAAVPVVAAQCGRRGVRALVVVTAGLGEQAADLLAVCRRHGMRLVGPNCLGICVPATGLHANFGAGPAAAGAAGVVVQSGGIGAALLAHLTRLGVGVSSFASAGDKLDVSSNDLLTWWEQDGTTRLAVLYVESFGSPRKFARTARRVGLRLPVLTVLGGRSAAGQQAAASRTAAAATPALTQEALFGQAGVIVTRGLGELLEAAALLAGQPLPSGNRVAIVSSAGGAGVLAADACTDHGLRVAALSAATQRGLRGLLPAGAALGGPVDTTAAVSADAFRGCLEQVAADDGVDAVLAVVVPTAISSLVPALTAARLAKPLAAAVLDQAAGVELLRRPDAGSVTPADGGAVPGVPAYAFPEAAARALGHAARYHAWRERRQGRVPALPQVRGEDARALVTAFLAGYPSGGWLTADATRELLSCYQVPLVSSQLVHGADQAAAAAAALGGPVVLTAEASGAGREPEAGAVELDLHGEQEVRTAYRRLAAALGDRMTGVLVQPMLTGGVEVLAGVVTEPVFGPLVVFGLGGIAADVLGDHTARLTPLTDQDADDMIREIRAAPLLLGHRGTPAVDTGALADVLLRVSRLADDIPEVAELDLNPVIARPAGACAVNARIRLSPVRSADPFLRRLR
jgi:acyl-CoA synthetase (NDP forming)/GNAT superfamily N-acetyltransferase